MLQTTGTTRIAEVRDLQRSMPWTGTGWVISAAAVTGAPPFGTFLGELLIVVGAIAAGLTWVAVVMVVAIMIAFLGVNSQIGRMVFGEPPPGATPVERQAEPSVGIVYLNLGVALVIGIASVPYLATALAKASSVLGGGPP